jgi:hypothetical protein
MLSAGRAVERLFYAAVELFAGELDAAAAAEAEEADVGAGTGDSPVG